MAVRLCLERGCNVRIQLDRWHRGPSYCPAHEPRFHQSSAHRRARAAALDRSGGVCAACGSPDRPMLHHIDGDPSNHADSNTVILCRDCHTEAHRALRDAARRGVSRP